MPEIKTERREGCRSLTRLQLGFSILTLNEIDKYLKLEFWYTDGYVDIVIDISLLW
ncbi:hypothetical protein Hanom_Chr00s213977g01841381 [Helianthus anomalus]